MNDIDWIREPSPGRLAIMPCPAGGDFLREGIRQLCNQGVDNVVSRFALPEAAMLYVLQEAEISANRGGAFLSFPCVARTVRDAKDAAAAWIDRLTRALNRRRSIVLPRRAGIGRSALIAPSLLMENGMSTGQAFEPIGMARGCDVPDKEVRGDGVTEFEAQIGARQ